MRNGTIIFHVSEDYLAHHGILGQKWGKRNGPPYPLDEKDYSKREKQLKKDAKIIKKAFNKYDKKYGSSKLINSEAQKTSVYDKVSKSKNVLNAKKEYEEATKEVKEYNALSDDEWKKLRISLATRYVKENPSEFGLLDESEADKATKEKKWIEALAYSDAFQNEDSAFGEFLKTKYNTTYKDYEKKFYFAQKKYKQIIDDEVKSVFNEIGDEILSQIETPSYSRKRTISDVQTDAIIESLEGYDNLWLPVF